MSSDTDDQGNPPQEVDYLAHEVNIFRPKTPFMRENLRAIFWLTTLWVLFVFGPVTASVFFPEFMTETRILGGFPLNFFMTAMMAPGAALVLAGVYAKYRDHLDEKYNPGADAMEEK